MKELLTIVLFFIFSNFNFAAIINWDNDSGDNLWSNPINWSTNTLPGAADDVSITNGGLVTLSGLTTTVKSIYATSTTVISIETTGNLTVDGAAGHGINLAFGDPILNNSGTINIVNAGGTGFLCYGDATNFASGTISIENSGAHNFHLQIGNTFTNNGTFTSTNSGNIGLLCGGDFENTSTGDITISGAVTFGISVLSNRSFKNEGTITLFSNVNSLINSGDFENTSGAILDISNSTQGLQNGLTATLTNDGTLSIANSTNLGLHGNGTIINNNTITIDGTASKTAFLSSSNTTNNQGAIITILDAGDIGLSISSGKTFDNSGEVIITNTVGHGISAGGTLKNNGTGVITISNAGNYGLLNGNNKTFTNAGSFTIDGTTSYGMFNQGFVTIDAGANLSVSNAGTYGIFHQKGTIDNSGNIDISVTGSDGIYNSSTITTTGSGEITIENTTGRGFYNFPTKTFTNNGILSITATTGAGFLNTAGGNVTNNGTIKGIDEIDLKGESLGGNIKPGFSPGTIDLMSDQTFTGTYEAEIGGTVPGTDHDIINVTGMTTFSGLNIDVVLINGFVPVPPQEFTILTSTTISGTPTVSLPPNTGSVIWVSEVGADFVKIKALPAFVLPVELIYFAASAENEDTKLSWKTASETNNEGFEIQHSSNGIDWKILDFMEGAGNSVTEKSYTFNHINPGSGNHYYRLKQMDFDGNFEFSKVRSVDFNKEINGFLLSPNPSSTTNDIVLSFNDSFESGDLAIFDLSGKRILQRSISSQREIICTSDFPKGIYFVQVTSGRERMIEKLIIE